MSAPAIWLTMLRSKGAVCRIIHLTAILMTAAAAKGVARMPQSLHHFAVWG